jgi:hypothetical protein
MIIMSNCLFVKCIWIHGRTKRQPEKAKGIKKDPKDAGKPEHKQKRKDAEKNRTQKNPEKGTQKRKG